MYDDRETVKRLLRGDEAAFRDLFDSYFPKLYRYALARLDGQHDEAVDMVQETFCKAFERLGSFRGEGSLYGWMCRILRNSILDLYRRRGRELPKVTLLEDQGAIRQILDTLAASELEEPETIAVRSDVVRLIQATMDRLPGHYGDVLEWKYVDGLSVKAIAERLDIGPKAAESLLTRARAAFRRAMEAVADSADVLPFAIRRQTGPA
ncbi:MAG: RNA polymerase sigma factor [Rhodospirillales bacterium]|nr:RNA polymerase sigma factor [Rhodospirillales bacterium]